LLVRIEKEKVAKKEEDTALMRATIQAKTLAEVAKIDAEKAATVSKINSGKEIAEKEAEKKEKRY